MKNQSTSNVQAFIELVKMSGAYTLDSGALMTGGNEIEAITGNPDNELARFAWTDGENELSAIFTEGGIAKGEFQSDGKFVCEDHEGNKAMQEKRRELLEQSLRRAQKELEELGFAVLISPGAMPQGYSLSLVAGESEHAIVAAYTAQSIGSEFAHVANEAKRTQFAQEVADNIADRAITYAAARPE